MRETPSSRYHNQVALIQCVMVIMMMMMMRLLAVLMILACSKAEPGWRLIDQDHYHVDNITQSIPQFSATQPQEHEEEISSRVMSLLGNIPNFDLRRAGKLNEKCVNQLDHYDKDLKKLKLWALQMFDANAKLPSGILNGNVNQYGDFDTCIGISHTTEDSGHISGKYCLTSFQITISENASTALRLIHDLTHSYHVFRSKLTDPGHRVPRFSSMNWAFCVPNECTTNEIEHAVKANLESIFHSLPFSVEVLLEPEFCQTKLNGFSDGFKFVSLLFLLVIVLTAAATLMDEGENQTKSNLILSFSLKRTVKSLFSLERSKDDVHAVHGIRFLNAIMLIISHKSMAVFFRPYANRTEMANSLGQPWSAIGRSASLYTDPFLMFSGMLTCYTFIGRLRSNKAISVKEEVFGRLIRLVPSLGALILFCTWILPEIGSGPQWPLVVDHHAEICKKTWWRNFLFIHNYFGFENMCLTHTHHVGIDTELFAVGILIVSWFGINIERTKKALWFLVITGTISTIARFYVSYTMNLANYLHVGTSIEQMFETADYLYIIPPHRYTVYAMGIILGIFLKYSPRKLTQAELRMGWILSTVFLSAIIGGTIAMADMEYKYSTFNAAAYAAFAPVAWCFTFAWIVYVTHHGYENILGRLSSWKYFTIWTRLSYAVYLTQFPIFFYYVGQMRTSDSYNLLGAMADLKELALILASSIVLTLLFDLPFQNIKKLIFSKSKVKST